MLTGLLGISTSDFPMIQKICEEALSNAFQDGIFLEIKMTVHREGCLESPGEIVYEGDITPVELTKLRQ